MTARVVAEPVIQIEEGQETATVIFDDGVVRTLPVVGGSGVATEDSVRAQLYEVIEQHLNRPANTADLLRLAEAFAWTMFPNQPHGGGAPKSS